MAGHVIDEIPLRNFVEFLPEVGDAATPTVNLKFGVVSEGYGNGEDMCKHLVCLLDLICFL